MDERGDAGSGIDLRIAGADDVETLQAVFERAGDHFLRVTGRAAPDPDAARRELASASSTPGREAALIEESGADAAVGAIGWWTGHPDPDIALLGMLLIVEDERGRGHARAALRLLEGRLRTTGIARLRTAIGAEDEAAGAFLQAVGFTSMDERKHVDVDSGRLRIAFYEKSL